MTTISSSAEKRSAIRLQEGTFIAVFLDSTSQDKLFEIVQKLNIPNMNNPRKYHSTVAFSKVPIHEYQIDLAIKGTLLSNSPLTFEIWPSPSGVYVCVGKFKSDFLSKRQHYAQSLGAKNSHEGYTPHITVSYDIPHDFKLPFTQARVDLYADYEFKEDLAEKYAKANTVKIKI